MDFNRKKLGAAVCALIATAVVAGTAAASHTGTPGVSSKQVVIGGTFPLTGPAALYKTIPAAEEAYYAYVDAKGGVNGRQIVDKVLDDAYDPSQTGPDVKQLVEKDHVFAVVGSLGTAPGLATWGYLNKHKVPQVLLATGDAYWGDCVHKNFSFCHGLKPWTMGWQPDYPGEARLYAKYILAHKSGAKIGVLYQNDAYGLNLLKPFKGALGKHAKQIVDAEPYNATDSAQVVGTHVASLEAHGADTFVIFATPAAAIAALATESAIHWTPLTILNNVSANRVFMQIAAQNGASDDGVISTNYVSSPTTQASLPGMKLAKKIIDATGNSDLIKSFDDGDANIVYGLGVAYTFVDGLKHAGKSPTRTSLMHALRNLNEKHNPFLYPGMSVMTSKTRTFPMEQLVFIKWSGGGAGDWHPFGGVLTIGH